MLKLKIEFMRKLLKKLTPPIILDVYREIYIKALIYINKKMLDKNKQDIKIYDTKLTADKLNEWGKGTTWNEIQMFFVAKKGKILDLACGTGLNILDLKKINPEAEIYGCDISQNLIEICIENGIDKNKLLCADANDIQFEENFFNYSYSIGSLEHFTVQGIEDVIKKLHFVSRTLKDFVKLLINNSFFRVHKSHLINLKHIKNFYAQSFARTLHQLVAAPFSD